MHTWGIHSYLSSPLKGKPPLWETLYTKKQQNYYKGKTNMWKTLFNGTLYLAIQTREPMEPISKTQHGEFWESLTHLLCHIAIVKLNSFSFDQHVILWSLRQLHFHVFSHVLSASHPWPLTP